MFLGNDVTTIRTPAWLVEQAELFFGHLLFVAAIPVHDPDIIPAAAIRRKGDTITIGGESRLDFPGQPFGNTGRVAAGKRHGGNIAQQSNGDAAASGGDIDIDPATLLGDERHLVNR